jgi:group I intron endonuclease
MKWQKSRGNFFDLSAIEKVKASCVYKLTFDNQKFYIGSTTLLSRRIAQWKRMLLGVGAKRAPINIRLNVYSFKNIKVEILEHATKDKLIEREDFYIKQNLGNPLFLNTSKSAFKNDFIDIPLRRVLIKRNRTHIGKPKTKEQLRAMRDRFGVKVDQFTLEGTLIATYNSAADAAESVGANKGRKSLDKMLRGASKSYRGFVFKYHNPDKIKPFKSRSKPKELWKPNIGMKGKKAKPETIEKMRASVTKTIGRGVDQLTLDGKFIAHYQTTVIAAKESGVTYGGIKKCLYGACSSSGGFIWKFTEPTKMKHIIEREKQKLKS